MSFLSAPLRPLASPLLHGLLPRIDHRIEESSRPFDRPELLRPHVDSRLWAATHYGVFIPQLPEPLRYLNTMTLIGAAGAVVFDNDYLARPDARRTTTVLSSTAAPGHHHYRAYDSHCDCNFGDDGTLLAWSDDLIIEADHPVYRLTARYENFGADLTVTATDQVSWFIRSPVYDHLSLLATFSGSVDGTEVAGLCTVEYARFMSPQSLSAKPLPEPLKLPIDFFTYQIINIDDRTQLLLTDVRAAGVTACRLAHVRSLDGTATVYDDVRPMSPSTNRCRPSIRRAERCGYPSSSAGPFATTVACSHASPPVPTRHRATATGAATSVPTATPANSTAAR